MFLYSINESRLDEALTINQILSRMHAMKDPSEYPIYTDISGLKTTGWAGMKSVLHQAQIRGETGTYMVNIAFDKVEFQPVSDELKENPDWNLVQLNIDKHMMYKTPSTERNPARSRCTCKSFAFRASKVLDNNKSIIGPWHKYTRKTPPPPKGRPYVNPGHDPKNDPLEVPYLCKHLVSFLRHLEANKLLK